MLDRARRRHPPARVSSRALSSASALACLACAALLLGGCGEGRGRDGRPRLVVVLVVDQMRPESLRPDLPGGLGHLARAGRVFANASLQHATTETCPGHVTVLTGRHPGPAGIPGNNFVLRESGKAVYCVEDFSEGTRVLGGQRMRSPRNILATALGDWLQAEQPGSRVFAVSGKDRAAIALGGQAADGAYWYDYREARRFTTSGYYAQALPDWVEPWDGEALLESVPEEWVVAAGDAGGGEIRHPLRVPGSLGESMIALYVSPFLDEVTLGFARALVDAEGLGRGPGVDLLAVSLSATDSVGHLYGSRSLEAEDTLRRLDDALGSFLESLEQAVGPGRVLGVLTSDHGVLPLAEWPREPDGTGCPLASGRIEPDALELALDAAMQERFGAGRVELLAWLKRSGTRFTVDRELARAAGVEVGEIVAAAERWLESQPGVERAWTAEEIEQGEGPEPFVTLDRNSYHPERGGDLVVQPVRGCLFADPRYRTSHGTPYEYDRKVPLVFFGAGVEPGRVEAPAAAVDIAPTLAAALGVRPPPGVDGRVLPLSDSAAP
jgi:predicted AlkP superfamily pyrophosphatase or phosphodiesterase